MTTVLDMSVRTLARSLDRLETALADKLEKAAGDEARAQEVRAKAGAVRRRLSEARDGLALSITELRALLDAPAAAAPSSEKDAVPSADQTSDQRNAR